MEIKRCDAGRVSRYLRLPLFSCVTALFILLHSACAPANDSAPPPDLIAHDSMVTLLGDLSLAEAALGSEPLAAFNDTLSNINVLKEHGVSRERFLSSFRYYTEHPKQLRSIYAKVLARLDPDSVKKPPAQ